MQTLSATQLKAFVHLHKYVSNIALRFYFWREIRQKIEWFALEIVISQMRHGQELRLMRVSLK